MSVARRLAQYILVSFPMRKAKKFHSVDPSCKLGLRFRIDHSVPAENRKYVKTGRNCILNCRITFESSAGEVVIGDSTEIGNSTIICRERVSIGNNVTMAWGITVYDHDSHSLNHALRRKDHECMYRDATNGCTLANKDWNDVSSAPIRIKDDAWIGMNSIILKGVTIGRGAVVGAGSVVTKDVPDFCVVAGNPAKIIKRAE